MTVRTASQRSTPAATELCDGADNDCNGVTDEDGAEGCHDRFLDADRDGYGDAQSRCACVVAAPYDANNDQDCYDGNADAHPGQSGWFTSHRGDGSFDYDCDGVSTRYWTGVGYCAGATDLCDGGQGWLSGEAPCGETGTWMVKCHFDWFSCGSACCEDTESRTQKCQ